MRPMRNRRSIVGMVLLTLCCACSGGGTGPGDVTGPVASIAVDAATTTSVFIGSTISLVASAHNSSGATIGGQTFTWSSSNPLVATVSSAGVVTGVAAGVASISASIGSIVGQNTVAVSAHVHGHARRVRGEQRRRDVLPPRGGRDLAIQRLLQGQADRHEPGLCDHRARVPAPDQRRAAPVRED